MASIKRVNKLLIKFMNGSGPFDKRRYRTKKIRTTHK